MNHDTKLFRKWMRVLRDPESKKTTGQLQDIIYEKHRCCLGHCCHAAGADVKIDEISVGEEAVTYSYLGNNDYACLPETLAEELDITATGCFINKVEVRGEQMGSLTDVNDNSLLSPAEIADLIEENKDNFIPYDSGG